MGLWLVAVFGAAVLVVGGVMLKVGLDRADQVGSVVGALVGVIGLGVATFSAVVAVRALRTDGTSAAKPPAVRNSVRDSTIDGPNVQVGSIGGDANIEVEK
ncbi:hypothetical protein GCM10027436_36630 [Actinophytocola sediminis]